MAGLGTGKAQRYFASDFDRLSNRLFDASEVAVVGVADLARGSAVCMRSASTAMQYWLEENST